MKQKIQLDLESDTHPAPLGIRSVSPFPSTEKLTTKKGTGRPELELLSDPHLLWMMQGKKGIYKYQIIRLYT